MNQTLTLSEFNALSKEVAKERLLLCCGSSEWADKVLKFRPYASLKSLMIQSENIWNHLPPSEWLIAFKHHPKIGDVESLRKKFATTKAWAEKEQGGVASASENTLKALAEGNDNYEKRHGFIFIVCASGKSADEMLQLLQGRLHNSTDLEVKNASMEQAKITQLRLEKMIHE